MAYAVFSVVFGEQPSAAKWNILGTNDASFNDGTGLTALNYATLTTISNPYKFNGYLTAAQNVGTGATLVQFNAENFDTNSNFDTATNKGRYTAPVAGFYQFNTNILTTTAGSGTNIGLHLYKNGVVVAGPLNATGAVGFNPGASLSIFIQLSASDYMEVYIATGAAAKALDVSNNGYNTFSGHLVSRT